MDARRRLARGLRWVAARLDAESVPRLWTIGAVARDRSVSREAVYRWVRDGYLRPAAYYPVGDMWTPLFRPEDARRVGDRRRLEWRR